MFNILIGMSICKNVLWLWSCLENSCKRFLRGTTSNSICSFAGSDIVNRTVLPSPSCQFSNWSCFSKSSSRSLSFNSIALIPSKHCCQSSKLFKLPGNVILPASFSDPDAIVLFWQKEEENWDYIMQKYARANQVVEYIHNISYLSIFCILYRRTAQA